jgi:hypothetical protein
VYRVKINTINSNLTAGARVDNLKNGAPEGSFSIARRVTNTPETVSLIPRSGWDGINLTPVQL